MDYSRCLGLAAVGFMVKFVQSGQSKRRTSRANKLRRIFLSKMKKLWVYRWTSEGTDVSFERQSKMSTAPINSVTINCGLSGEINKTNTYIHTIFLDIVHHVLESTQTLSTWWVWGKKSNPLRLSIL